MPSTTSTAPAALAPGTVVFGRYVLESVLGEGGMGAVWAAHHMVTRRPVALKILKRKGLEHSRRFLREARIVGALKHPNVVTVYDILQFDDGTPVMVMDWLVGESLGSRLTREGTIPMGELARVMMQVADAVAAAHAHGIVHRDLKPENIFLCREPNLDVKVLDFGIAKLTAVSGDAAQTAGLTGTGDLLGTPYYMAPEQVFGEKEMDHRADIWSLGVILYQCLAGRRPVDGENVGQILKAITMGAIVPLGSQRRDLPVALTSLVDRMLSREKEQRPSDLTELVRVLGTLAGVESTAPMHVTPSRRTRSPRAVWGVALAMVASATVGAVLVRSRPAPQASPNETKAEAPASAVEPAVPAPVANAVNTANTVNTASTADADAGALAPKASPPAPHVRTQATAAKRAPTPPVPASASASAGAKERGPRLPGGVYGESPYR